MHFTLSRPAVKPGCREIQEKGEKAVGGKYPHPENEPHLGNCENLTDLSEASKLRNLTTLHLSGCENLTSLAGLEDLKHLTSLKLSNCFRLETEEIERLQKQLPNCKVNQKVLGPISL